MLNQSLLASLGIHVKQKIKQQNPNIVLNKIPAKPFDHKGKVVYYPEHLNPAIDREVELFYNQHRDKINMLSKSKK